MPNIKITQAISSKQNLGIEPAPHLHAPMTTEKIMLITSAALLPAFFCALYFFGCGIVWQLLLITATAGACEIISAYLRRRSIFYGISDMSFVVTSLIMALTLPPLLPWYYTVAATAFAMLISKAAFGGLGMNIFNPAMVGFIFILVSLPEPMTKSWISPAPGAISVATIQTTKDIIFNNVSAENVRIAVKSLNADVKAQAENQPDNKYQADGITGATYLESLNQATDNILDVVERSSFSKDSFKAYVVMGIAYLLGGIILLIFKITIVRMVIAYFTAILLFSYIGHFFYPDVFCSTPEQLLLGGTMLCGFFIITDPVTNAGTAKGRIVFATYVAFLIVLIRGLGSYSDSVAFAVLLGNSTAPLIDVLTHRRPFGVGYKKGGLD
ncbi:MAG: RnfABCDGE type electron transport complex subunit D [Succinivibrio sp.]|nr:RnfABCDGE type electron transport complex subunit D [Succinivibrio sp.]